MQFSLQVEESNRSVRNGNMELHPPLCSLSTNTSSDSSHSTAIDRKFNDDQKFAISQIGWDDIEKSTLSKSWNPQNDMIFNRTVNKKCDELRAWRHQISTDIKFLGETFDSSTNAIDGRHSPFYHSPHDLYEENHIMNSPVPRPMKPMSRTDSSNTDDEISTINAYSQSSLNLSQHGKLIFNAVNEINLQHQV